MNQDMTTDVMTVIGGAIAFASMFLSGVVDWLMLSPSATLAGSTGSDEIAAVFHAITRVICEMVSQCLRLLEWWTS
jgi:hypothetical protein